MEALYEHVPSLTTVIAATKYGATGFAIIFSLYAYFVFTRWEKDFAGQRLSRTGKDCPSNAQPPAVSR